MHSIPQNTAALRSGFAFRVPGRPVLSLAPGGVSAADPRLSAKPPRVISSRGLEPGPKPVFSPASPGALFTVRPETRAGFFSPPVQTMAMPLSAFSRPQEMLRTSGLFRGSVQQALSDADGFNPAAFSWGSFGIAVHSLLGAAQPVESFRLIFGTAAHSGASAETPQPLANLFSMQPAFTSEPQRSFRGPASNALLETRRQPYEKTVRRNEKDPAAASPAANTIWNLIAMIIDYIRSSLLPTR